MKLYEIGNGKTLILAPVIRRNKMCVLFLENRQIASEMSINEIVEKPFTDEDIEDLTRIPREWDFMLRFTNRESVNLLINILQYVADRMEKPQPVETPDEKMSVTA